MYETRKTYPKGSVENTILKLCLNSSYGQSGNEHSYLYDLLMMISICINGQLLLMMLTERIVDIQGVVTSENTDGLSVIIKKDKLPELKKIFDWWQELTGLELEYAYYSEQHYRDVNNYLWKPYKDTYDFEKDEWKSYNKADKPKIKGCFVDNPEWHKDHSMLIVQKALIAYYHKKIPVETTIGNCKDIYDFCKMVKAKGCKFTAEWYDNTARKFRKKQGKVVRYYITKSKGHYGNVRLMKYLPPLSKQTYTEKWKNTSPNQMDIFDIPEVEDCVVRPDRIQHVEASNPVEIFNKFEEKPFEEYNVDLSYYINECNKIIKAIK